MSGGQRPNAAEKADAVDRLIEALDRALVALSDAGAVVLERQPAGSYSIYPLFPLIGDDIRRHISKARESLWEAHKVAAVQGYDAHRAAQSGEVAR